MAANTGHATNHIVMCLSPAHSSTGLVLGGEGLCILFLAQSVCIFHGSLLMLMYGSWCLVSNMWACSYKVPTGWLCGAWFAFNQFQFETLGWQLWRRSDALISQKSAQWEGRKRGVIGHICATMGKVYPRHPRLCRSNWRCNHEGNWNISIDVTKYTWYCNNKEHTRLSRLGI